MNPKWNTTESYDYQRKKLFSFEGRPQTKRVDGAEPAGSESARENVPRCRTCA